MNEWCLNWQSSYFVSGIYRIRWYGIYEKFLIFSFIFFDVIYMKNRRKKLSRDKFTGAINYCNNNNVVVHLCMYLPQIVACREKNPLIHRKKKLNFSLLWSLTKNFHKFCEIKIFPAKFKTRFIHIELFSYSRLNVCLNVKVSS